MKSAILNVAAVLFIALLVSPVRAAEALDFSPADLLAATDSALNTFMKESPDHAMHMTGFKAWKTGTDAKVKIYVLHGSSPMEINYLCIKSSDRLHCTRN